MRGKKLTEVVRGGVARMYEAAWPSRLIAHPTLLLLLCFLLSLAVYATQLVFRYDLYTYAPQTPISLPEIVQRQKLPALRFVLTFLCLFGLYAVAYRTSRRAVSQRLAPLVLVCGVILALLLGFTYPIGANDVVNYAFYGEVLAFHGENPMVVPPTAVDDAAFADYAIWRHEPSPYGPLWTWISAAVVWITGTRSLVHNLLAFKAVAILCYTGQALLIYGILRRRNPTYVVPGLLAFAWNPLVLYEFAANGHNDAMMMAFVLLGIFFWDRGRPLLMVAALTLSMLIKIPLLFLFPLFLVAVIREQWPGRRFWSTLVAGGLLAAALGGVAFLTLPDGPAALFNLSARWSRFTHSLPAVVNLALQQVGLTEATAQQVVLTAALVALVSYYALQMSRIWRSPKGALGYAYATVLFLLLFATLAFQPWYVTWLVALAVLFPHSAAPAEAGLFSLTVTMSYVIYGFVWFWYANVGNWGNNLGITLMAVGTSYALPWAYTAWLRVRGRRGDRGSSDAIS